MTVFDSTAGLGSPEAGVEVTVWSLNLILGFREKRPERGIGTSICALISVFFCLSWHSRFRRGKVAALGFESQRLY